MIRAGQVRVRPKGLRITVVGAGSRKHWQVVLHEPTGDRAVELSERFLKTLAVEA